MSYQRARRPGEKIWFIAGSGKSGWNYFWKRKRVTEPFGSKASTDDISSYTCILHHQPPFNCFWKTRRKCRWISALVQIFRMQDLKYSNTCDIEAILLCYKKNSIQHVNYAQTFVSCMFCPHMIENPLCHDFELCTKGSLRTHAPDSSLRLC